MILDEGVRADGRGPTTSADHDRSRVLPRTHGSCLFTRGETQAWCATLAPRATSSASKSSRTVWKSYMLHYNFPPSGVGETRPSAARPARDRHGALRSGRSSRSSRRHHFPYTIRIVSDILEFERSSSMASVCGGGWR